MPEPDEVQARVLMTYPSDRWRQYVDNIAIRGPAPTIAEIFAGMKMLKERQNARDEAEHGEANYAGRGGGGNLGFGGGGHQHQQQQQPLRQNSVRKLLAWQPRCVTAARRRGTTQTSAASVTRPSAAFARSKVTFSLPARGRITLVVALVGELGVLEVQVEM